MYSKKKLKELIKEETATSREYAKHGFHAAAKDEKRHAVFFKFLLKRK